MLLLCYYAIIKKRKRSGSILTTPKPARGCYTVTVKLTSWLTQLITEQQLSKPLKWTIRTYKQHKNESEPRDNSSRHIVLSWKLKETCDRRTKQWISKQEVNSRLIKMKMLKSQLTAKPYTTCKCKLRYRYKTF